MKQSLPIEQVAFILGCIFLATIVALYSLKNLFRKRRTAPSVSGLADKKLCNIYSRAIRKGVRPKNLARVFSQIDTALIISLLSAAGIPAEILYPRMNNLRMGVAIAGYNDSYIRVLYPDHLRASELVGIYIKKRVANGYIPMGSRFLNLVEYLVTGILVNPRVPTPELLEQKRTSHVRSTKVVGIRVHPQVGARARRKTDRQAYGLR